MILQFNEIPEHKNNNLTQGYEDDFGYDIRSGVAGMIPPRCCSGMVYTGLHVCIPAILGATLKARGSQIKQDVMLDGTIDSGYTGDIFLKLYNFSNTTPYRWEKGDRIAQLVFHIRPAAFLEEMSKQLLMRNGGFEPFGFAPFEIKERDIAEWPKTARGRSGFGSSRVR